MKTRNTILFKNDQVLVQNPPVDEPILFDVSVPEGSSHIDLTSIFGVQDLVFIVTPECGNVVEVTHLSQSGLLTLETGKDLVFPAMTRLAVRATSFDGLNSIAILNIHVRDSKTEAAIA